jgi:hypothetical protein
MKLIVRATLPPFGRRYQQSAFSDQLFVLAER